jgi:hypothetical protein
MPNYRKPNRQYVRAFDINALPPATLPHVSIGQWVYAGERTRDGIGRFMGVKPSGTIVVAWLGNGRSRWRSYCQTLRQYALAK